MKIKHLVFIPFFFGMTAMAGFGHCETEVMVQQTLKLEQPPLDITTSRNGRWLFVLTDQGRIKVYSSSGKEDTSIPVDKDVDQIQAGPQENILYLKSKKNKTVQIIEFDQVRDINIAGAPFKGPENAPVTLVIFSDFQCPYCSKVAEILDEIHVQYPKKLKIVFKHYPLRTHKWAQKAAVASFAAHNQGKFWEFHDKIYEISRKLNKSQIKKTAQEIGLDMDKFQKDIKNSVLKVKVRTDRADGIKAGVRSTPSIFINGRRLRERSMEAIIKNIEKEIASSNK